MIQTELMLVLLAASDVTDIVSTRIYPMRMPQRGSLPAVVYQQISNTPVNSLDGDSGLDNLRFQITAWARTYSQAVELSEAVRNAIAASSTLKAITENIIDTEDPDTRSYGVIADYSMWYTTEEAVPAVPEYILLETGDSLLLESGDKIVLEV